VAGNLSFHKHLVFQVSLFVTVVLVVTITYLSSYISHQQSEAASQQLRHQAEIVAENLASAVSSYVISRNYTLIEEILLKAAKFDSIYSMQVMDVDGHTLSDVAKGDNSEITPRFNKIKYKVPVMHEVIITQTNESMVIFSPIDLGDVVGWVRIVFRLDRIRQAKMSIWINNLTNGFFIAVITIVILMFFLRKPVVSIRKYTDFADKLNEYNGDVIKVDRSSVEMSRLGVALNSASTNLYEHHETLQDILNEVERVAAIAEHSTDIIISMSSEQSVEYINETAKNIINSIFPEYKELYILKILPDNIEEIFSRCMSDDISFSNIESYVKDRIFLWKFTPLCSQKVLHCHAVDITERKQVEEKLAHSENFDLLTNLPNRTLALDRLIQSIKRSRRLNSHVGIMFLGVDRFKSVNDTLGHSSGDKIIRKISARLTSCLRDGDTLARFGGDIFLIILNDLRQALDIKIIAEKSLNIMLDEFDLGSKKFKLSLSIGITSCPDDETDANKLIRNADIAMHKAKENGGNIYQFYASEFNEQALIRVELESELRRALERNEFFLTYQPQIDINSNKIIGAEALIRWVNHKLGFIPPDRFISVAEDTGLIIPIGEWVLRTACNEARLWQETFGFPLRVAVNVSARQFVGHDFPQTVKRILEETGLSVNNLELEMTESLLVEDDPRVMDAINELKKLGVTLALDDFGTGYSSLSYLKRFPFDILKIDRAFIKDVMENPEDASLCKAIIAIASSLKLDVVGEGVETKEQLDFLRAIGTDIAQGYYHSKPLERELFIEYVKLFNK